MKKINEYLHKEEIDYVEVASTLGVQALPSLKKIIETGNSLASKAQALEKIIRLCFDQPLTEKKVKEKPQRFSTAMRKISTNSPDGHIKGFGSDMRRSR